MGLKIIQPGPQCTLQAAPRLGMRHMGIPASGPADILSHAIANRLVSNPPESAALEITYGPFEIQFLCDTSFSLTGAEAEATLNGEALAYHASLSASKGDVLKLGVTHAGLRTYLALSGGLRGRRFLGSTSTYLPAGFGGHEGRALRAGDVVGLRQPGLILPTGKHTPSELRLKYGNSFALRSSPGPDLEIEAPQLWSESFTATRRADRSGIELEGPFPDLTNIGNLPSAGILPGALQLPSQGRGFLLLPDCQTTGGYPHILQVNRADRHLMGQIRPGDSIIFLKRSPDQADEDLKAKQALIGSWISEFSL